MQIWTCTGGQNQRWTIATGSTTPPVGSRVIHPGASNSVCVSAPNNADGGVVVVNPCDGSASQGWNVVANTFVIYGNKCLGKFSPTFLPLSY